MSKIFANRVFAIVGNLPQGSNWEVSETVKRLGGRVVTKIDGSVSVVLSCEDVALILSNPYKLQFSPELRTLIDAAHMYNIPIIDSGFVNDCVNANRYLNVEDYAIEELKIDIEAKYRIKSDVPSDLDPRVQELIQNLFNQSNMDASLVDLGLDVRKIPLIDQSTISRAFGVLKTIEEHLSPAPGQSDADHNAKLTSLSNDFFGLIPHSGSTAPIKTAEMIKEKASMLTTLTDIEIAQRLMRQSGDPSADLNMNPIDVKYRKLRTKITPLEAYQQEYSMIQRMVENTQSTEFPYTIELEGVYEVEREGEQDRFAPFAKMPHHRLLWHGSRMTNYIGILSQGLRVAPPEAPVTGYFLGKGIYFANMVAVSGQYCKASKTSPIAYLLLADVALGRSYQLAHGKFIGKEDLADAGFHSVKCCGTKVPDPAYDTIFTEGIIASLGKEAKSIVPVSELIHDEIVIYSPEQANIKYMLKVKFSFPTD
jgi:poly [ADP-ribose] polymerase